MKRMTYWCDDGQGGGEWRVNVNGGETTGPHVDRLAAIEDILGDEYDLDRLRKLIKAEQEGRCAVMPCEISHKLYDITGGEIVEKSIVFIPLLLTKSTNHLSLSALDQRDAITAIVTQDIGKTVFLTRAEAEAALRREQDD